MSVKTLTPVQRKLFFMSVREAARDVGEDPESYRKRILREELGVEHMSEVSRGSGFDKLMTRLWIDRGDYDRAASYSGGSLHRLVHLVVEAAKKVIERKGGYNGSVFSYLGGVLYQAHMLRADPTQAWCDRLATDNGWMDFTEAQIRKVLMMLNVQLRR